MMYKLVYFVDGEEQSCQFDTRREVDNFLALLEAGTRYKLYQRFKGKWEYIRQSTTIAAHQEEASKTD